MKNLILAVFILLPAFAICQGNEQIEKLKMMEGTWRSDQASFKSSVPGFTEFPDQKIKCVEVTTGSLYCEYFTNDGEGNYDLSQSELFAYDQATDKIYNMTFEGPSVHYGYLTFKNNLMTWTSTDVEGNIIQSGTMLINSDSMDIKAKIAGSGEPWSVSYVRDN